MVTAADLGVKREDLEALCQRWQIKRLSVFGSAARGEMRPDSDVDLMIELKPGAAWGMSAYMEMKQAFEALFGRQVDLIREGTIQNPFRRHSIAQDLTVLYAA